MFDWATAAFINRRSRMAEVMATVPTAAQAARRINWRRVKSEYGLYFINSFLDEEIRRAGDQMNDGADAVAHLRLGGWRTVGEIGAGDVVHNARLGVGRQLPGH